MNDNTQPLNTRAPKNIVIFRPGVIDDIEQDPGIPRRITSFDREVYTAICSIYHAGKRGFMPRTIWKMLTGSKNRGPIKEGTQDLIKESIERLTGTTPPPTAPANIQPGKCPTYKEKFPSYRRPLLQLTTETGPICSGVGIATYYVFQQMPEGMDRPGNYYTIPATIYDFNLPRIMPDYIAVRGYLVRKINEAAPAGDYGRRNPLKIKYADIYDMLCINNAAGTYCKQARAHQKTITIIEGLQQKGLIKNYDDQRDEPRRGHGFITLFFTGKQAKKPEKGTATNEKR